MKLRTWESLNIDVKGRDSGILKTKCPQCGPTASHANKEDLSINLDNGKYRCWNDGTGCGFKGALSRAASVETDGEYGARQWDRPKEEDYLANLEPMPDEVIAWFTSRGISQTTLDACEVGWGYGFRDTRTGESVKAIYFPYRNVGQLINVKRRSLDKQFRLSHKAELIPWRIDHRQDTTYWVEGELDALALVEAGFDNVLSVPNGGTKSDGASLDYLRAVASEVSEITHHILVVDDDEAGHGLREEMVRRWKPEHCSYVTYPEGSKDANDVLMKHGVDALRTMLAQATPYPSEEIARANDALIDLVTWKRDGMPLGLSTGLKNLDGCWTIVPGELTVITGIPGAGKSNIADQIILNLANDHQWKSLIFSPEYYPFSRHMIGLVEKRVGKVYDERMAKRWRSKGQMCQIMTEDEMRDAVDWINQYISFIIRRETMGLDRILELARTEVYRRGIKVLVIDPWNEIEHELGGRGLTETLYISQCLTKIKTFAQQCQVHVFLVAHPTKMQATVEKFTEEDANGNELQKQRLVYPVPSLYSISGGANWRNKADNGLIVWRDNHAKAHGRNPHLVEIHVDKVRWKYDGAEGMAPLIWDPPSGQFRDARADEVGGDSAPLAPVSVGESQSEGMEGVSF